MNKLVFITGGSRGIGKQLVTSFVEAGYKVAFSYCQQEAQANTLASTLGNNCFAVKMDQGLPADIAQAISKIEQHFATSIDVLINNAAIAQEKPFEQISADDWANMLNTNLQGPFLLSQALAPKMVDKGQGRIINITSIGGQWGGLNQVHYAASKAGLISLTQSLAKVYSAKGITSNAIAIGLVETDMTANELSTEAGKNKVAAIPMQRMGTTEDIAGIALFLASEQAAYLTGQTLNANGGMYFG